MREASRVRRGNRTQPWASRTIGCGARFMKHGAEGGTRTRTAFATAPSRRRVYQFHHFGELDDLPYLVPVTGGVFCAGTSGTVGRDWGAAGLRGATGATRLVTLATRRGCADR